MKDTINMGGILSGDGQKTFIIAEMSGNHSQSLEKAMQIVKAASDAGASAIKLQTYTPDSLTIDHRGGLFDITDESSLWKGRNLYELYQEARTPYEWHKPLFDYAKDLNLVCFSTPFDEQAVDMLEELGSPVHKIASFENNFNQLLKKVAGTGKPVIMSTGISEISGIAESVDLLRQNGTSDLALLKCTSTYPASPENTNLLTIPHMKEMFKCHVGLSDHTMGIGVPVAAITLGATVIEKHFCLSRAEGGVDSAFSLEPHEFKLLVEEAGRARLALGEVYYGIQEAERKSINYKRSLYVVQDIREGEVFTAENIRVIRPGDGMAPKYYEKIIGKKSRQALSKGTPLKWDLL